MSKFATKFLLGFVWLCFATSIHAAGIIVLQTDFGLSDGAVSEVKGVMYTVDKSLLISDLTHNIPAYHIWDAAYRLFQVSPYWPKGTVFVSVVDPGVGTARRSIVAETNNGNYFVTPDNGTLTLIKDSVGIKEVRVIDENKNRLPSSRGSYTFFGRDVFGYTAAKLAAGKINFAGVGPVLKDPLVSLPYQKALIKNNVLYGTIVTLDNPYGNVWTNISRELLNRFGFKVGNKYQIKIYQDKHLQYDGIIAFHHTFGEVKKGDSLLYINSLFNLAIAINQGSFANLKHVASGQDWLITVAKV